MAIKIRILPGYDSTDNGGYDLPLSVNLVDLPVAFGRLAKEKTKDFQKMGKTKWLWGFSSPAPHMAA